MAGNQSWAEKRWWRGTVFDWMGVLLLLLLIFVLAFVSAPFLLLRHTVSSGLQDYYLTVYRSTCASWERRTAALPYVLQPNGVQQARLRRRRRRAAAGAERELPADAFEGRDRRWGQRAAVRAGIRMADGSGLRGAVQANSGECVRHQARHPLVDVGTGSGHPFCDRFGLRAPPSRGQKNASGANAPRRGTAERGAIQSAEAR